MRANCTLEICLSLKLKSSIFPFKAKIIHYFPFKAKIIHFFEFKTKIIHFFQFKAKIIQFFPSKDKLIHYFQLLDIGIGQCEISQQKKLISSFQKKRIILEDQFSVLFEILSDLFSFFQKKCLSLLYLDPSWFLNVKLSNINEK